GVGRKLGRPLEHHLGAVAHRLVAYLGAVAGDDQALAVARLQRRDRLVSDQAQSADLAQVLARQSLRAAASDEEEQYLRFLRHFQTSIRGNSIVALGRSSHAIRRPFALLLTARSTKTTTRLKALSAAVHACIGGP